MRWYDIEISGGNSQPISYKSTNSDGTNAIGALDIEFDIHVVSANTPQGNPYVRIFGIPLLTVKQQNDLNGANISLAAGFSGGLPLENASQKGIIASGKIFQAFGNWLGNKQTLDLYFYASGDASATDPLNIGYNWKKGTQLGTNIQNVLTQAFPDYTIQMNVSQDLALLEDTPGTYQTLNQFNDTVNQLSMSLKQSDDKYTGISIVINSSPSSGKKIISVFDNSIAAQKVVEIKFNELVGQPTWIGPYEIQFICPLRSDLSVGDNVKLPPTQVTQAAVQRSVQASANSAFSGNFIIKAIEHVGRFRDPSGENWVTYITAAALNIPSADVAKS
jgi:hypothetical protein